MHGHTHRFFASPAPIGRNGHRLKDQAAPRRPLFSGLFRHPPDLSPEMTVALCAASSSPRRRHCPATAAPRFFIANIPFPRRLASTALSNPKRAASSTRRAARGNPRPRRPLARAHRRDGVVIRQRELSGDAQAMQSWGLQALFTPSSRQDPRSHGGLPEPNRTGANPQDTATVAFLWTGKTECGQEEALASILFATAVNQGFPNATSHPRAARRAQHDPE